MAVTQGHGNPRWTRDETILAMALYLDCADRIPGPNDPRVVALSSLLRRVPYHADEARKPTFRNPDGVAFKLQNIRQVATGKGLGNVSQMDRDTWAELGSDPEQVRQLAASITSAIDAEQAFAKDEDEERGFFEGKVLTRVHLIRERNAGLRGALLKDRHAKGNLRCDMCDEDFRDVPASIRDAAFEAHHILPLGQGDLRKIKVRDMALLCACCHRLIHRLIAERRQWVSVEEAREVWMRASPVSV
ncbi:HNH endonuclease [Aureimonas flava]|uniref:HNH endonuclease n=1 Tax=Aureimonas flava TaxID=2320271 RepID=A0A3A1WHM4_9HYPH|nr:HNH endonuclease [Aureimonas flava]RIX99519.1 HNH endonuclease [Aureimonas flava]